MQTIHDGSPSVNSSLDLDNLVSEADREWWARRSDSWHDQDAEMECGYSDFDCSIDHELDQVAEVERWFRARGLRQDRVNDFDQPHYRHLGRSAGYIDRI